MSEKFKVSFKGSFAINDLEIVGESEESVKDLLSRLTLQELGQVSMDNDKHLITHCSFNEKHFKVRRTVRMFVMDVLRKIAHPFVVAYKAVIGFFKKIFTKIKNFFKKVKLVFKKEEGDKE